MSVSTHLAIELSEYDTRIRTFIPHYEEMLDVVTRVVALRRPRTVVDLGTGTGALALRISRAVPGVAITGIDVDEGMLSMAARRLGRRRVALTNSSFMDAEFPRCDAFVASFALHHIERPVDKRALYKRVQGALRRGGMLVSADCHPAGADWLASDTRHSWLAHLAASYGRTQGERFLTAWAREDFYTPLRVEEKLLQSAGFATEVVWRKELFAVIVAQKSRR